MLTLVACAAGKLAHPAPARDLYDSQLYRASRTYAERMGAPWYILSAKHGLLHPDTVVEPYDVTLNTMTRAERIQWSARVINTLVSAHFEPQEVVLLAGRAYREHLTVYLEQFGFTPVIPMLGLGIGQQLAYLKERNA